MKTSYLIAGAALIVLLSAGYFFWQNGTLNFKAYMPSRTADTDCEWTEKYTNKELGVSFRYEKCKNYTVTFQQDANKITAVIGGAPSDTHSISILTKPSSQTDEQAILAAVTNSFTPYQKAHCIVERVEAPSPSGTSSGFIDTSKIAYHVTPDSLYKRQLEEQANGDIPELGCGPFGWRYSGISYFEFHPNESKTTFAFVDLGQDSPAFDEESIRFLR